jgi:hypothetical protein
MNADIRRKAAVWLVLVFVLGAATGGVFGYTLAHRTLAAGKPQIQTDAERRAQKVQEMTQAVGLSTDQAQKIDAIIAGAQAEGHTIRDKSDADMDTVRQKARDQMRALLTADQKPKFEEYVNQLDAQRKRQKEMQGH